MFKEFMLVLNIALLKLFFKSKKGIPPWVFNKPDGLPRPAQKGDAVRFDLFAKNPFFFGSLPNKSRAFPV